METRTRIARAGYQRLVAIVLLLVIMAAVQVVDPRPMPFNPINSDGQPLLGAWTENLNALSAAVGSSAPGNTTSTGR